MRRQIEDVWSRLLAQESALVELMAKEVESLHGYKPTGEQVLRFLKNLKMAESHPNEIPLPPIPKKIPRPPKKSSTRFVVTMSDGERIDYPVAADTFVEVIEKLGLERVEEVKPKLLSTSNTYRNSRKRGRYYININLDNDQKKNILENIAEALGVRLQAEIVAKN